jgi:hypothetical protein
LRILLLFEYGYLASILLIRTLAHSSRIRSEDIVRKSLRRAAIVSVAAVAALTVVGVGTAHAGPVYTAFPDPSGELINGWGSATTQDVYGAFTQGFTYNGTSYTPGSFAANVGSWNSINPNTGATQDNVTPVPGGDTFQRPFTSGDGENALSAANGPDNSWVSSLSGETNTLVASPALREEEVSFARSSSLPPYSLWTDSGRPNDLTFIPQAIDAVGVAEQVNGSATPVTNLNTGALTAIYTGGTYTQNTSKPTVGDVQEQYGYPYLVTRVTTFGAPILEQVVPVLPDASSDTRSFFLSAIGAVPFDDAIVADETGPVAQAENNAEQNLSTTDVNEALTDNNPPYVVPANSVEIVPFSGATLIEQEHGLAANTLGDATFPTINGESLWNGESGVNAGPGTLQSGTPVVNYEADLEGDFTRYVWAVLPSSEVTADGPADESALQEWLDLTLPSITSVWQDFGFTPLGTTTTTVNGVPTTVSISDMPALWVTTEFTNDDG